MKLHLKWLCVCPVMSLPITTGNPARPGDVDCHMSFHWPSVLLECHPWDVMRIGLRKVSGYSVAWPSTTIMVLYLMCWLFYLSLFHLSLFLFDFILGLCFLYPGRQMLIEKETWWEVALDSPLWGWSWGRITMEPRLKENLEEWSHHDEGREYVLSREVKGVCCTPFRSQ